MYYAIRHKYRISTMSRADTLYRFATAFERDEVVCGEQWDGDYRWEPVTRARARRLFPRAFKALDWTNGTEDERWEGGEWLAAPTGGEYAYMR